MKMAFTKRTYVNNQTVITAENMNQIQDEIIRVAEVVDEGGFIPEKGVDYWTEADKSEIVADVLAALPAAEGASY
jgi:hypothetical protein